MDDAVVASLKSLPNLTHVQQPPAAQQNFVVDDGGWTPPRQTSPAQHPPSSQPRQHNPVQQQQQPQINTNLASTEGDWDASQQTPTQGSDAWNAQARTEHIAELRAKDEALESLRVNAEQEKAELYAQMEKLRLDVESTETKLAGELTGLRGELDGMKTASERATANFDAQGKEKDLIIERMKEDVEGKEHNIDERNATIAELKRQLEAEKSKEVPRPTPADLIPDLDPW